MNEAFETPDENRESSTDAEERYDYSHVNSTARIARYDDLLSAPLVTEITPAPTGEFIDNLATTVYTQSHQMGGTIGYAVIREVSENFIHAQFTEVTVSILDGGNTIRFADHGPGIPHKDRAQLPGFSSAIAPMKGYIRGVGSGLPIAKEYIESKHGTITIEDNLVRGSVVTISLNAGNAGSAPSPMEQRGAAGSTGADVPAIAPQPTAPAAAGTPAPAVAGSTAPGVSPAAPYQQPMPQQPLAPNAPAYPAAPAAGAAAPAAGYPVAQPAPTAAPAYQPLPGYPADQQLYQQPITAPAPGYPQPAPTSTPAYAQPYPSYAPAAAAPTPNVPAIIGGLSDREREFLPLLLNEGALGVTELVNLTGYGNSSVSNVLKKLETAKLVEKNKQKKRELTSLGQQVAQAL